jgi:1,4-dihydroxy-2-naphthoate octaprenyltransferase
MPERSDATPTALPGAQASARASHECSLGARQEAVASATAPGVIAVAIAVAFANAASAIADSSYPWLASFRPKTLTAALVPVVVGSALAAGRGEPVLWWAAACALFSAALIQVGTNLVNDALDFRKGADDEKRIGPKRATQSGQLRERTVLFGGFACFALAAALGIPLAIEGGWPIVAIGLLSLLCGYGYTGGPYPLAYKGMGDLFVIVFFGLIAVSGTYWLHAKSLDLGVLVAGLQVGMLATVLIAVNNLRDAPLDARVAKRTLAVRFGVGFARAEIAFLSHLPFLLGAFWLAHGKAWAAALPLLAFPLAIAASRGVRAHEPGPVYNKFLGLSAALHLVFGLALAIGLALP